MCIHVKTKENPNRMTLPKDEGHSKQKQCLWRFWAHHQVYIWLSNASTFRERGYPEGRNTSIENTTVINNINIPTRKIKCKKGKRKEMNMSFNKKWNKCEWIYHQTWMNTKKLALQNKIIIILSCSCNYAEQFWWEPIWLSQNKSESQHWLSPVLPPPKCTRSCLFFPNKNCYWTQSMLWRHRTQDWRLNGRPPKWDINEINNSVQGIKIQPAHTHSKFLSWKKASIYFNGTTSQKVA